MSYILCIETGTDICSVGLVKNGELVSLRESSQGRDHAGRLGVFVDEILEASDLKADRISAVAVSKGPGSYTGLRIGVSFAKGFCYGLGIPLIGIGSLDSLACVACEDNNAGILGVEDWQSALLCPMIDARRMEVYAQVFDPSGRPVSEVGAHVIDENSFARYTQNCSEFLIFGSGAKKCEGIIPNARYIDVVPSARGLASAAQQAFEKGQSEDIAYFEPLYLKDFVITQSKKKIF